MARRRIHVLLLTGAPGIGKTTVLRQVAEGLGDRRVAGFLTDEIRERGRRMGFLIAPFGGVERVMAHVEHPGNDRVGRHGVDVAAIDAVSDAVLGLDPEVDVYLVDEIGKMECLSPRFVARMRALLDSDKLVVATIARTGSGFISQVKDRRDVELREVTVRNREACVGSVLSWIGVG